MITAMQKALVIDQLKLRVAKHADDKHICNDVLPAGSPMYYYCKICRAPSGTLPESHTEAAPRHCADCARMFKEYGFISEEVNAALGR